MVHHALTAITAQRKPTQAGASKTDAPLQSGLRQVERDFDVAPRSVGIRTCLAMRSVHNALNQTRNTRSGWNILSASSQVQPKNSR